MNEAAKTSGRKRTGRRGRSGSTRPAPATREAGASGPRAGLETEALLRSTLDSLSAHIAVLDETGTIVAVNEAWRSFAVGSGYPDENHGIGANYVTVCEQSAAASPDAARTAAALRDILAGRRTQFRLEYPCTGPDGPRWFQLRATRPAGSRTSRIVVAHEDITEVKQAHEALAQLTARLMKVQDDERRALARELHDTTAQNLLAVTLNTMRLKDRLRDAGEPAHRLLAETLELAEQSLQEVRTLSYVLHPPLLDVVGLSSALKWLAQGFSERSGIAIETSLNGGEALPQDVATALFRIAQEALANIHRHSGSDWARIDLRRSGGTVRLEILDRGRGLEPSPPETSERPEIGLGISGMRLRIQQLGGELTIQTGGSGTRVTAILPMAPAAEAEHQSS